MHSYDDDDVRRFMTSYGMAHATGDLEALGDRLALPALWVDANGGRVLAGPEDLRDSLNATSNDDDAVAAVPVIDDVEEVGTELLWASVHWSVRDENGNQVAAVPYRYLLRRGRENFTICVVVRAQS